MVATEPPSPSLAELSRNTSVISSSSSSSTSSLVPESEKARELSISVPVRPTRTFAAPAGASQVVKSRSQASLLPGYIQRELGISPATGNIPSSSVPLYDADKSDLQKQRPRAKFNSPQDFEFGDILGHGSFSTVIQAKGKKSGRTYAIKVLDKAHLQRHNQRRTAYAEKDALVALGLSHPGVVGLHSTFSDAWSLYFVLDLLPNGDLRALISRYGSLSLECTRYYIAQLTDTIMYMHSKNVMHRDIKPENLLLDSRFRLALADFGTAKVLPSFSTVSTDLRLLNTKSQVETLEVPERAESVSTPLSLRRSNTFVGTPQYYSPELLAHSYTSPASDLWALGCVLFELYAGTFAFNGPSPLLTWRLIKELKYDFPEGFDEGTKDLVRKLLVTDPEQRLGARGQSERNGPDDLKDHIFFKSVEWDKIWDVPHPKLASGLKAPPEAVVAQVSDEELGAQLRDERLRDEDADEIPWAKEARLAAYLPGLRHTDAGVISYRNGILVDTVSVNDGQRATENSEVQKFTFPVLNAYAEDDGLPYSSSSRIATLNGVAANGPNLEKKSGAEPLQELHLGPSLTGAMDGNAKPSSVPSSISDANAVSELLHILEPAETIIFSSSITLDTFSPTFTRVLPKLLPGSIKKKSREHMLLLTTFRRLLCVSGGGNGTAVKQEFTVGGSGASSSNSSAKLAIEGVEMRGGKLALLTNGEPVLYTLANTAVTSKLMHLIRDMLQNTFPGRIYTTDT